MAAKTILALCASALLVQSAYSVCMSGLAAPFGYSGCGYKAKAYDGFAGCGYGSYAAPMAYEGAGCGCGTAGVASTGGGLAVASTSPIAPVGISVLSENAYEGTLAAGGNLPFLGGVAIEGVLPTAGAGAVSYGCGDGAIGYGSEGPINTGIIIPEAVFPPGTPSTVATTDALALVSPAYNEFARGTGYGFGSGCGYKNFGFKRAGCGCRAVY